MASAGEIRDVRKWNANVNALSKLRKDPNVSLAIGGIFFTALRDRIDETTKEPKPSEKQRLSQLLGRLEHPKNVAKIYRGIRDLGHVGADSSPEMIVESIKKLRSGIEPANAPGEIPERLVHFLALRKYNRNMVPESGGLRHQDIYAAIVLLSGEREKNREASKDRQTKAKAE